MSEVSAITSSQTTAAAIGGSLVAIISLGFNYLSHENEKIRIKMERDEEKQKLVNDKLEKRMEDAEKKANEAINKVRDMEISHLHEKLEMRRENDALVSEIRELKSNNRRLEDQLQTLRSELMKEIEEIKTKFSLEQQRSENHMSLGFARLGMF